MNGGRENSDEHLKYCRRAAAFRKIDRGCHVVSVSIYILRLPLRLKTIAATAIACYFLHLNYLHLLGFD